MSNQVRRLLFQKFPSKPISDPKATEDNQGDVLYPLSSGFFLPGEVLTMWGRKPQPG
jgi:hypothetical protein